MAQPDPPRRRGGIIAVVVGGVMILGVVIALLRYASAPPPPVPMPLELAFGPGVRLTDSASVTSDAGTHRVAHVLLDGAQPDTILGLLTTDLPTVVGDTSVVGLATDPDGMAIGMFRYRIASRRMETLSLPSPWAPTSGIRVSPGGRWQVYVVIDSAGWAQGVIQRFPNGPVLRRSPLLPIEWTGGRQGEVEWTDELSATLYVDTFRDGSGRWLRLRGGMDTGKWRVDTIKVSG